MQTGERKDVYKVYDRIADWFFKERQGDLTQERNYLDNLISLLPEGGTVLDLGCGTGKPILEYLRHNKLKVTGVDASYKMLEIARTNFPDVEFVLQDMRLLDLGRRFDADIAWHSFFHLPEDDQPPMFARFAQHLNHNGILIFTSGPSRGEAWGVNGGENLFHASLDTEEYKALLLQNGFEVLKHVIEDPDCGGATVWVARYNPA